MSENNQITTETPPSLDLAFNWVKDVLINQSHAADILDGKATTLFSVATVILGIGISARILLLKGFNIGTIFFSGCALISYCFVIFLAYIAMQLRRYETLDNPIEIRKWYWDMQPSQFKIELLGHLEDSYTTNERNLSAKARATSWLVFSTAAEVIFLMASLALAVGM